MRFFGISTHESHLPLGLMLAGHHHRARHVRVSPMQRDGTPGGGRDQHRLHGEPRPNGDGDTPPRGVLVCMSFHRTTIMLWRIYPAVYKYMKYKAQPCGFEAPSSTYPLVLFDFAVGLIILITKIDELAAAVGGLLKNVADALRA